MDLMVLTDAELIALGCRLNGGTFGRDAARMTKLQKVAHVRDLGGRACGGDAERSKALVNGAALSILNARKGSARAVRDAGDAGREGERDASAMMRAQDYGPDDEADETDEATHTLPDGSRMEAPGPQEGPTPRERFDTKTTEPTMFDGGAHDGAGAPQDGDDSRAQDARSGAGEGSDGAGVPDAAQGPQGGRTDALEARVREMIAEAMAEATDGAAEEISDAIEARLGDAVATIRAEMGARAPREIALRVPALPPVSLADKHPIYGKAFALLSLPAELRRGWGLALVGPMGSGKTTIAKQLADDLGATFGAVSCSADMTRGAIDGRILPIGDGRYVPSELVRLVEASGADNDAAFVYSFDEFDAGAAEIQVAVNAPLSNGGMHVEPRAFAGLPAYIPKGDGMRFIAQMNTYGTGGTMQYAGRALQDGATMDRWLFLYVSHDWSLWARTLGADYEAPAPWVPVQRTDAELAAELRRAYDVLRSMAERCEATGIERTISFRAVLKARACLAAGFTWDDTLDVILAGWDADQRAQVTA